MFSSWTLVIAATIHTRTIFATLQRMNPAFHPWLTWGSLLSDRNFVPVLFTACLGMTFNSHFIFTSNELASSCFVPFATIAIWTKHIPRFRSQDYVYRMKNWSLNMWTINFEKGLCRWHLCYHLCISIDLVMRNQIETTSDFFLTMEVGNYLIKHCSHNACLQKCTLHNVEVFSLFSPFL